jgi:hypothetical protein
MTATALGWRHGAVAVLAATHLGLVGVSAAGIRPGLSGAASEAVAFYGAVAGADNSFSFFAPGVPSELKMRFGVALADGSQRLETLSSGVSAEDDRRINNTLTTSLSHAKGRAQQRVLLSSWAAKVFARYPGAERVVVHVDWFDLPTMPEYAAGRRGGWRPLFSVGFERGQNLSWRRSPFNPRRDL